MRADRLISILLLLKSRGNITARELADKLEVSLRTIYRDIEALSIAGVPLYTIPGVNGGLFLEEDYRLRLADFSKTEIETLLIKTWSKGPLDDLGMEQGYEDTLLKLFGSLPSAQRHETETLRQRILIDPAFWFQIRRPFPFLPELQFAVWSNRRVGMRYAPPGREEYTRNVDAYGLIAKANTWYLVGLHDVDQWRTYHIARIKALEVLEDVFTRAVEFDLEKYWDKSVKAFEMQYEDIFEARLCVRMENLVHFEYYLPGRYWQLENDSDGWIDIKVHFYGRLEAMMVVMGLGEAVRIIEPIELKDEIMNKLLEISKVIGDC